MNLSKKLVFYKDFITLLSIIGIIIYLSKILVVIKPVDMLIS